MRRPKIMDMPGTLYGIEWGVGSIKRGHNPRVTNVLVGMYEWNYYLFHTNSDK